MLLPWFLSGCFSLDEGKPVQDDLLLLQTWMTGSFSSQEQSQADPEFFDIRLEMVPIWPERIDGYWLYVEQAAASSLDKPYRQRVYHLTRIDENRFESAVYELEDPLQYAGIWKDPAPLSDLYPEALIKREGASIYLEQVGEEAFSGSTRGKECKSNLRGASYATSEVRITEGQIYSWDRGFNEQDEQVWGAVKGGYIFKKIKSL
jgi:hypothetical protein